MSGNRWPTQINLVILLEIFFLSPKVLGFFLLYWYYTYTLWFQILCFKRLCVCVYACNIFLVLFSVLFYSFFLLAFLKKGRVRKKVSNWMGVGRNWKDMREKP